MRVSELDENSQHMDFSFFVIHKPKHDGDVPDLSWILQSVVVLLDHAVALHRVPERSTRDRSGVAAA